MPLVTGNDAPNSYQISSAVKRGFMRAILIIAASTCDCCAGVHLALALAWLSAIATAMRDFSCLVSTMHHVFESLDFYFVFV